MEGQRPRIVPIGSAKPRPQKLCYAVHSLLAVRAYETDQTQHQCSRYVFILTYAKWIEVA